MNTTTTTTAGARCAADISALLRARNPLIWLVTREEARAERVIVEAAASAAYPPTWWDCANGFTAMDGRVIDSTTADPQQALATVRDASQRGVYVMRDLHAFLRDPYVCRSLRSLCRTLPQAPRDKARAIVVVTPSAEVPPELAGHAIVIDLPLPDRDEIAALLDSSIAALPDDMAATAAHHAPRD
jgi:hypothetical protein